MKRFSALLLVLALAVVFTGCAKRLSKEQMIEKGKYLVSACGVLKEHTPLRDGTGSYAQIDAISKPTKKVIASGEYDRAAAAARERERAAKYGHEADDDDRAETAAPAAPARSPYRPQPAAPAMPPPPVGFVPAAIPAPPAAAAAPADNPENDDVPF